MDLSVKDFTSPMAAVKPRPIARSRALIALIGVLSLTALSVLPACPSQAATIVLDPGHGGNDSGAGTGSQFAEKHFTLTLAQKISDQLAARHRVELTRTSDVQVPPADRAAAANHLRADLMISLHGAVPPYCGNRAAAVYFHNHERMVMPEETSIQEAPAETDTDRPAWAALQIRYQRRSQLLADALRQSMIASGTFDSVTVSGVPLAPLMGADLPAALVEVGCMHPAAAPNPQMLEQQLNDYAASIASAIEAALPGLVQ